METKVLIVAVVEKDDKILMRKKPDGSPPYDETWYVFGAMVEPSISTDEMIIREIKAKSGIDSTVRNKVSWDTEVKYDFDGIEKFFVYLDVICDYKAGELVAGQDVERLEWVAKTDLNNYDVVPPSRVLFRKLGYIN